MDYGQHNINQLQAAQSLRIQESFTFSRNVLPFTQLRTTLHFNYEQL
jgi:hypothetical protein